MKISLDHLRAECYHAFLLQDAKGFEKNFEALLTAMLSRMMDDEEEEVDPNNN